MSKLWVTAAHLHGPLGNGSDGCHARYANDGMCPGVETAAWLNGLGEDDAQFGSVPDVRNIDVRLNWLRGGIQHVVAADAAMEALRRRERAAQKELRAVRRRIRQVAT